MEKAKVSIVKKGNDESLKSSVKRAVDLIGGFEKFIRKGSRVLVKPNIIGGQPLAGTMTDVNVVRAVCDLAHEAGADQIYVGDTCHVGGNTTEYAELIGLLDVLKDTPYIFVDFKKEKQKTLNVDGKVIDTLRVPEMLDSIDTIINVPVMKTHMHVTVTLATKNIKGLIHDSSKRKMHEAGIEDALVDMAGVLRGDLNIIDGIIGSEGRAPSWGESKPMGLILAGEDPIALDTVCSKVMCIDSTKIGYLQKAARRGIGIADLNNITVVGEKIEDVKDPFELPPSGLLDAVDSVEVINKDACSGCMAWLSAAISQFYDEFLKLDEILKKKNDKFYIILGTNAKESDLTEEMKGKTVFYGRCAIKISSDEYGEIVKGCPPALLQDLTTAMQKQCERYLGSKEKIFTTV